MPKRILKYTIIAAISDGPWSPERIRECIEQNGGIYCPDISDDTSHLLCCSRDWRKKTGKVKKALKRPGVHIVSFDWLEDTLKHGRKMREDGYSWKAAQEHHNKRKRKIRHAIATAKFEEAQHIKREVAHFRKGALQARDDLLSDNHHIFRDFTGFDHDVVLVKRSTETNTSEQSHLRLYESNAVPHTYATFFATYQHNIVVSSQLISHVGSTFTQAFRGWQDVFENETKKKWHHRLLRSEWQRIKCSGIDDRGMESYLYRPPPETEPQGYALISESSEEMQKRKGTAMSNRKQLQV